MSLKDEIWLSQTIPPTSGSPQSQQQVLLYLIPGNPGLIEYYRTFLTSLSDAFTSEESDIVYHVVGKSLGGFTLQGKGDVPTLSLRDQITFVEESLADSIRDVRGGGGGGSPPSVILIGHSVGAYILLELLSRRQRQQQEYEMIGGICLFPTIVDIAKSPSGRKLALLAKTPLLAPFLQFLAKILCALLPSLPSLIQTLTAQPPEAAKTTAAFLRSKTGVLQALSMARHELNEITHDAWPPDVWDAAPLYFLWGGNDHWVANETRDQILAARAEDGGGRRRPVMEVDWEGRLPHDFCIRPGHSRVVAGKVAGYVRELMGSRG